MFGLIVVRKLGF